MAGIFAHTVHFSGNLKPSKHGGAAARLLAIDGVGESNSRRFFSSNGDGANDAGIIGAGSGAANDIGSGAGFGIYASGDVGGSGSGAGPGSVHTGGDTGGRHGGAGAGGGGGNGIGVNTCGKTA